MGIWVQVIVNHLEKRICGKVCVRLHWEVQYQGSRSVGYGGQRRKGDRHKLVCSQVSSGSQGNAAFSFITQGVFRTDGQWLHHPSEWDRRQEEFIGGLFPLSCLSLVHVRSMGVNSPEAMSCVTRPLPVVAGEARPRAHVSFLQAWPGVRNPVFPQGC